MQKQTTQRNQRVKDHLQLVTPIARHYAQRCGIDADDLRQVGLMGLLRAAENFNTERCTPFKAFARPHIRGAILHYLRDNASVVRFPRRLQSDKEMNESGKQCHGLLLRRVYCGDETVADTKSETIEEIDQMERSRLIQEALKSLRSPERSAIQEVVLDGRSLRAAGRVAGVSAMTMQRRVKRGLSRLRLKLEPQLWAD
ncbi:Possible type 3 alternative RNA polymerase sigma factor [Synechococcus sp. WH 7805]|nr:Possible type 3 alternative RNA polymerase sigma factor [Synechococcus sp. WH 7805]